MCVIGQNSQHLGDCSIRPSSLHRHLNCYLYGHQNQKRSNPRRPPSAPDKHARPESNSTVGLLDPVTSRSLMPAVMPPSMCLTLHQSPRVLRTQFVSPTRVQRIGVLKASAYANGPSENKGLPSISWMPSCQNIKKGRLEGALFKPQHESFL